jgi:antitoxin FitA
LNFSAELLMPTLTIKGMPDPLYLRLKQRAAEHRRSLNSEILVALEQVVTAAPPDAHALLVRVDALRNKLKVSPLTEARLRSAKAHGRR